MAQRPFLSLYSFRPNMYWSYDEKISSYLYFVSYHRLHFPALI